MPRDPIPTSFFALVVVRHGERFLLVHERKHGQTWYLPAGRAELGESLAAAAERETLEEAGLRIRLTGVLRIEHTPSSSGARLRVVFLAEPADETPPKSIADQHSLGARWVLPRELDDLELRGGDVKSYIDYVVGGGMVMPLTSVRSELVPMGA